jgi:hypothetical protein
MLATLTWRRQEGLTHFLQGSRQEWEQDMVMVGVQNRSRKEKNILVELLGFEVGKSVAPFQACGPGRQRISLLSRGIFLRGECRWQDCVCA